MILVNGHMLNDEYISQGLVSDVSEFDLTGSAFAAGWLAAKAKPLRNASRGLGNKQETSHPPRHFLHHWSP